MFNYIEEYNAQQRRFKCDPITGRYDIATTKYVIDELWSRLMTGQLTKDDVAYGINYMFVTPINILV